MNKNYQDISIQLIKAYERTLQVAEELEKSGELYQGYHPKMEEVQNESSELLERVIFNIGWPTVKNVGEEAAYAAWLILQHSINKPSLLRKSLPLLDELANNNEIWPHEVAKLHDRICFFEMRPQKYGTQFDFDENNKLSPWKIEDIENVDKFRKEVGLPPLSISIENMRNYVQETPHGDYKTRINKRREWSKKVGWI